MHLPSRVLLLRIVRIVGLFIMQFSRVCYECHCMYRFGSLFRIGHSLVFLLPVRRTLFAYFVYVS